MFRDETPKAARTGSERMGIILDSLADDFSDSSLVRQIFRISREYPGDSNTEFWNEWFIKLFNLINAAIENCTVPNSNF